MTYWNLNENPSVNFPSLSKMHWKILGKPWLKMSILVVADLNVVKILGFTRKSLSSLVSLLKMYANAYDFLLLLPLDINVLCDVHWRKLSLQSQGTLSLLTTTTSFYCYIRGMTHWGKNQLFIQKLPRIWFFKNVNFVKNETFENVNFVKKN